MEGFGGGAGLKCLADVKAEVVQSHHVHRGWYFQNTLLLVGMVIFMLRPMDA